jgi:UDP-3-O-[3-hydroxymyristoyl] N-acetylglucosamine deacetylase
LRQTTIKKPIQYKGIGILFAKETKIKLRPAPPNTGIVFNEKIKTSVKNAFLFRHSLGLKTGKSQIFFTEHLMTTCYGLGVSNLYIDVSGKEMPFGDGSSLPFVKLIKTAGIKTYQDQWKTVNLDRPIITDSNDSFILALPAKILSIDCYVSFAQKKIGGQFFSAERCHNLKFVKDIAPARTFGSYCNYKFLKKVLPFEIITKDGLVLPKVFRFPNEVVRHKILDLLGHIALLGRQLNAKIFAYKPSHHLNQKFVRELEELYEN